MKQITFYLKRGIKGKKKYVKVLGWENVLKLNDLPKRYSAGNCFWEGSDSEKKFILFSVFNRFFGFSQGEAIPEECWERYVRIMRHLSKRLSKILDEQEEEWYKEFEVKI